MAVEHRDGAATTASRFDGHRLSEFIYGTVTGLVAIVGIGEGDETSWWEAALLIVVGAITIWAAHAYAILLSKHVVSGRRLYAHELWETLTGSWPIVSAGVLLTIPLFPVAIGLWSLDVALWLSSFIGVLVLALIGIAVGSLTNEPWPRRLLFALLSAGLGLVVVVIEFAVHH